MSFRSIAVIVSETERISLDIQHLQEQINRLKKLKKEREDHIIQIMKHRGLHETDIVGKCRLVCKEQLHHGRKGKLEKEHDCMNILIQNGIDDPSVLTDIFEAMKGPKTKRSKLTTKKIK
jgi:hypothetical protein